MLNIFLSRYAPAALALVLGSLHLLTPFSTFAQQGNASIRVCATVPELGSLVRDVGRDQVSVTVFAEGTEDPHYVEARPSFIKAVNQCALYVQMGMELERGWAPLLLENSRNPRVQPGTPGYLDASVVISPLEVPAGTISRLLGDVHPSGNPHYLLDPLNGLRVARLIRDRLTGLRPSEKAHFDEGYNRFAARLARALVGPELADKYEVNGVEKLALLYGRGRLTAFLESQGESLLLGGWLGLMVNHRGVQVVDDHNMWPYFAQRFGIQIIGHMEPKPGVPPTTRHLGVLVNRMRAGDVPVVITTAYYDPRHAQFLASKTGAKVVPLAHQVGARREAEDYLSMVDYNVRQLAAALAGS